MSKLNDTHLILLAHGAQQENGSLHPLPVSSLEKATTRARADKAIEQLIGRGLLEERETVSAAQICRKDGDIGYGLFVTAIGLTAIGLGEGPDDGSAPPVLVPAMPKAERQTKSGAVLAMLKRDEGATMEALHRSAEMLRQAEDLRALIASVSAAIEKGHRSLNPLALAEWKQWATAEADRLDPVISGQVDEHLLGSQTGS